MEVVWTENALESFFKVVDYLFDHWTLQEIESFKLNVTPDRSDLQLISRFG
jgi:hypothetical protein